MTKIGKSLLALAVLAIGCQSRVELPELGAGASLARTTSYARVLYTGTTDAPSLAFGALAVASGDVWLCDDRLVRIPKDGGAPVVVDPSGCFWGISIDRDRPYWLHASASLGAPRAGELRTIDDAGVVQVVASGLDDPGGLAIRSGTAYWLEHPGSVSTSGLDTIALGTLDRASIPLEIADAERITADEAGVYLLASQKGAAKLFQVVDGGAPIELFAEAGAGGSQRGIAVDATSVYFVSGGHLRAVRKSIDGVHALVSGPTPTVDFGAIESTDGYFRQRGVVVDDAYVYVTANGDDLRSQVLRAPKGGGALETIATLSGWILDLVADGGAVYALQSDGGNHVVEIKRP